MTQENSQASTADRRIVRRRPLKKGVTLIVRKGNMDLGPNIATGGVELSNDGIQVRVNTELKHGEEIEIALTGIGRGKPMSLMADVRWCRPDQDEPEEFVIGARFRKRLSYSDMGNFV
jgi:hypothetical protein